jgi:hypothetical protein
MNSFILFGLCAPRLSITTTCPSRSEGARKCSAYSSKALARRLWRLWPPQCTSTHPSHTHSSRRSASGSCPCSLALGRKLALPWEPETEKAIHRDMHPALTHEYQPPDVEARNQPSPQGSRSLVAFLGYLRLFLSGHPPGRLAIERLIVASETSTPVSSSKASQCSFKVRSGLDFS